MTVKLLSVEEFKRVKFPFSTIKVENKSWGAKHRNHIREWIEARCGASWVYYDGDVTYVFGSQGDHILFSMWIRSDPFDGGDWENEPIL